MAARYLPGHESGVGGDWYDVFVLSDGELGIVVGDVSGHGPRSAVVMGRLRSALRSYALIEDDPGTVLTVLDRKIQHFEAGSLATVLTTRVDLPPGSTLLTYTDGLVERRGEVIDVGLERLARQVCAESAEAVCVAAMAGFGPGPAADDIAMLALHFSHQH